MIYNFNDFKINELREEEFNAILDKISKNGISSISSEEREKLDEFDGNYDDSPIDKVEFDDQGDLLVNGNRHNPYNIPDNLYDDNKNDNNNTELEDTELKHYLDKYLEENFNKKSVDGAKFKQIFDTDGNMIRIEELVRQTIWDMEIGDIRGVRQYIKKWIEK